MSARCTLLALAFLAPGCNLVSCEHEIERASIEPLSSEWPRARAGALPATPATEVVVRADRVEVRNNDLIATWPTEALVRAREASDEIDWPRVEEVIEGGMIEGEEPSELGMPELQTALERARRAERSATGAGSGAGVFNLRVASDIPFARVERMLYAAAQAGYGTPRVLLEADGGERMLVWPSARPGGAPTREQIEAALRGEAFDAPAEALGGRLTLTNARIAGTNDGAPVCAELEPCVQALAAHEPVTLEVAPDTRFERVTDTLQALVDVFDEVSVVGRAER